MSIMLPEIDFEKIGQRVKQARIDKGYTQAELWRDYWLFE